MATYSFSYAVIATDNDARAPTAIDNDVTVSGSHEHTPPVLSPFTANLGFGSSLILNMTYYSGDGAVSKNVNAGISLSFSSTTWSMTSSRFPSGSGWQGGLSTRNGTFRTGTDGTVEINVTWTVSNPADPMNTGSPGYTTGWVTLGSEGALVMALDVLGSEGRGGAASTFSDSISGSLSVSMRYAESHAVNGSGSHSQSISLSTNPGLPE